MYKHVECIWSLDFVESNNIHWLNKVFKTNNLVFKIVHHNFVVFNDTGNLKLLDTITKKSKSGLYERRTPADKDDELTQFQRVYQYPRGDRP